MMLFLPCPHCDPEELSAALWLLSRPASVREVNDTRFLFGSVKALDASLWLEVDDERQINIHDQALTDGNLPPTLTEILGLHMEARYLPPNALEVMKAKVQAALGMRILAKTLLPVELLPSVRTEQYMINAGLLAKPNIS